MGWTDFIPKGADVGGLIKKGTDVVTDGITDGFNAVKDSDTVKDAQSTVTAKWDFGKIEYILKNNVTAADINIKPNVRSELGEFLQKSLNLMDQNVGVDGQAGAGTVRELNGFFAAKQLAASEDWNPAGDKFRDLNQIKDITELSGRHVQAVVDELRDRGLLTKDNIELSKDLGEGLRDINNSYLQEQADELAPESAKQSSLETPVVDQVAGVEGVSSTNDDQYSVMKIG